MRILLVLLTGYFLIVLLAALAQRHMLYFPDTTPPSSDNLRPFYGPALAVWPATGDPSHRGYVSAEPSVDAQSRGTVVVFHGNAGSTRDRRHYISALEQRGYRVVLAEYPGYGGRDGKSGEATFISDGRETARLALEAFGGPLWIWGESLGAGVAAGVVADEALPVAGVALITPWDNLPDLAQALYWYLPARWLIRDQYDNRANLKGYPGPVAVMIAERDEIIPLWRFCNGTFLHTGIYGNGYIAHWKSCPCNRSLSNTRCRFSFLDITCTKTETFNRENRFSRFKRLKLLYQRSNFQIILDSNGI